MQRFLRVCGGHSGDGIRVDDATLHEGETLRVVAYGAFIKGFFYICKLFTWYAWGGGGIVYCV